MGTNMSGMSRGWIVAIFLLTVTAFFSLWLLSRNGEANRSGVSMNSSQEASFSTDSDSYPVEIPARTIITGKVISMVDQTLIIATEDGQERVMLDPETDFRLETCRAMTDEKLGAVTDFVSDVCSATDTDRSEVVAGTDVVVILRLNSTIAEAVTATRR